MPNEETTADAARVDREIGSAIREIEHTADLGMEVEADTLTDLFRRAAFGMMELVRDDGDDDGSARATAAIGREAREAPTTEARKEPEIRSVAIELPKSDLGTLLVRWLRELLYLQEVEGFVYDAADFDRLDASGLRAVVTARTEPERQIRELKGVTYHGLEVERDSRGWRARVIFDI